MASDYDYHLPPELIAQEPASPRHKSRLFVYDTRQDKVFLDTFLNISGYLPEDSIIVLNDTKVVPARLELEKESGGKVRVLFLMNEWDHGKNILGLADRSVKVGETLSIEGKEIVMKKGQTDTASGWTLQVEPQEFEAIIQHSGKTPLPPYIHSSLQESERREKYQTMFARNAASVAAPTASLHFSPEVFRKLADRGIKSATVTLHVGRGTFARLDESAIASGKLHAEPLFVGREAARDINQAKKAGNIIIASGTTSLRAIESTAAEIVEGKSFGGETSIFIRPPYNFKIADALVTNFHLPNTSLLMLLDAFLQYKGAKKTWKELYEIAVREKFRFYSFGDAMLII